MLSEHPADPWHVEQLVQAIGTGLQQAAIIDVTTPSEVLSALFTTLERTLWAMKELETPENQERNRVEVARVLQELLLEFGVRAH